MSEIKEENLLEIDTSIINQFCLSSARELSITRDIAERLVFAQLSEITASNVAEYYARLSVLDYAYNSFILTGKIFDENDNEVDDRDLTIVDFISRIGIKTNLKHDTLRNFLDRIVSHLDQLKDRKIIAYTYSYQELFDFYSDTLENFDIECDTKNIMLSPIEPHTVSAPGHMVAVEISYNEAQNV